jgi:hypothetical protein
VLDTVDLEALTTAPLKGVPATAPAHLAPTKSAALDFGMRYFAENKSTGSEGRGLKFARRRPAQPHPDGRSTLCR